MYIRATRAVRLRKSRKATITGRLPKDLPRATLMVWSSQGGAEFSPHVPAHKLGMLSDGKPHMVQPTMMHLIRGHRETAEIEIVADEDMRICIIQDADGRQDPRAKARIIRHGTIAAYARRWLGGIANWLAGRRHEGRHAG